MQAAVGAGILADCGGSWTCPTCRAYVDPEWWAQRPPPATSEREMLSAPVERREPSRLTCQIWLTLELDRLVQHLSTSQL
jgi:ferredoxin, 2Fe-2S